MKKCLLAFHSYSHFVFCQMLQENEYDLRSNMFYENHFWKDRKLTDQELNQAIIFITEILETKRRAGACCPQSY